MLEIFISYVGIFFIGYILGLSQYELLLLRRQKNYELSLLRRQKNEEMESVKDTEDFLNDIEDDAKLNFTTYE